MHQKLMKFLKVIHILGKKRERCLNWVKNHLLRHALFIYLNYIPRYSFAFVNEISSTILRKKLANSENVANFITEEVFDYIKENNLYRGKYD